MSNLNELIRMEHEVGTTNKPPKMMKVENYVTWKDRFQSFVEYQDTRMWMCIEDGYVNPTHEFKADNVLQPLLIWIPNRRKCVKVRSAPWLR